MSDRTPPSSGCGCQRRSFLMLGASLAGATLISRAAPLMAAEDCSPPIPPGPSAPSNGSTCPFPIPWLDKNGSHNQMPKPGVELSNIFHFKGKIARCADFTGMGTDNKGNRIPFGAPSTDYSYMQGEYWAARKPQQGTFAHIWLTLFQGQVAPANQIHDLHPPIAPSGLYWVAPVPDGGLTISPDGRTATLQMKDVPIIDQPKWPAYDAQVTPARMTFKLVWKATDEKVNYDDPIRQYRITGYRATAQLEASIEVPTISFSWKSDPLESSHANFGVIGDEVNGRYYSSPPA